MRRSVGAAVASVVALLAACTIGPVPSRASVPVEDGVGDDPVARALAFLEATQVRPGDDAARAGDWPQWIDVRHGPLAGPRIAEHSPFAAASVHLALARLTPEVCAATGLAAQDAARAARLRSAALAHLERFAVHPPVGPAGSYGFWALRTRDACGPLETLSQHAMLTVYGGPRPWGPLAPRYGPPLPRALGLWPDLDTTAFVRLAQQNDARLDGGPGMPAPLEDAFLAARDLDGRTPVGRGGGDPTGAYRVWLQPASVPFPNELDMVVAVHALLALARAGRTDLPGFAETVAWVEREAHSGRHRSTSGASRYYADGFLFHAEAARAFADGPVPALAATVARLADEVEAGARVAPDGSVSWAGPDDAFSTALALSALLFAGRRGPLVEGGVRHLLGRQDPRTGAWPVSTICRGASRTGVRFAWRSAAVPTALALEVVTLQRLAAAARGVDGPR